MATRAAGNGTSGPSPLVPLIFDPRTSDLGLCRIPRDGVIEMSLVGSLATAFLVVPSSLQGVCADLPVDVLVVLLCATTVCRVVVHHPRVQAALHRTGMPMPHRGA